MPGKEETASVDEKSDDLLMKVLTGEEDADATDSTAFDDVDVDKPATASPHVVTPPSPGSGYPDTTETESAPEQRSEGPEPEPTMIRDNKVILNEQPDWSLVAKAFEAFIPECKTIADIEGAGVRYRALSRRGRRTR